MVRLRQDVAAQRRCALDPEDSPQVRVHVWPGDLAASCLVLPPASLWVSRTPPAIADLEYRLHEGVKQRLVAYDTPSPAGSLGWHGRSPAPTVSASVCGETPATALRAAGYTSEEVAGRRVVLLRRGRPREPEGALPSAPSPRVGAARADVT